MIKVIYNSESKETIISRHGTEFDTSRIQGVDISAWIYPFVVSNQKWYGFYEEMKRFYKKEYFKVSFQGSSSDEEILRKALNEKGIDVVKAENRVVVLYDNVHCITKITVNGKIFDASRLVGRTIEEWVLPFQNDTVSWGGFFREIKAYLRTNDYTVQFVGDPSDMLTLMQYSPEDVDITFRINLKHPLPVTNQKSSGDAGGFHAGSALLKKQEVTETVPSEPTAKNQPSSGPVPTPHRPVQYTDASPQYTAKKRERPETGCLEEKIQSAKTGLTEGVGKIGLTEEKIRSAKAGLVENIGRSGLPEKTIKLAKIGLIGSIGTIAFTVLMVLLAFNDFTSLMSLVSLFFGASFVTALVCLFKIGSLRKSKLVTHIILILFFSPVYEIVSIVVFARILLGKVTAIEPIDTIFDSFKEGYNEGRLNDLIRRGYCCLNCSHYDPVRGFCRKKKEKTRHDFVCVDWFDKDFWEETKRKAREMRD